jgi:hypothetical protein
MLTCEDSSRIGTELMQFKCMSFAFTLYQKRSLKVTVGEILASSVCTCVFAVHSLLSYKVHSKVKSLLTAKNNDILGKNTG